MTDVSALGLGSMGAALARALLSGGNSLTVWNRSPARAEPLTALGARCAPTVGAAVQASPVVLVCVDSYRSTREIFEPTEMVEALAGRTVIQLSTGTPRDARESQDWFESRQAAYLDGAILAGPDAIGTPAATLLYAGARETFDRSQRLLISLSEETRFVGEEVGAAAALDLAWLASLYGAFVGAAHGAALCDSEGVDLPLYSETLRGNGHARWVVETIREGAYADPGATLATWNHALRRISEQAADSGISPEVPDVVAGILDRAEAAGLGAEHIAAIVEVLRAGD